jgi:hypothetical protein
MAVAVDVGGEGDEHQGADRARRVMGVVWWAI